MPAEIGEQGVSIHLDNDLFTGTGSDSDYSWGPTADIRLSNPGVSPPAGPGATKHRVVAVGAQCAAVSRASQLGTIAMTLDDLHPRRPASRPSYASLVSLTSSELRIEATGDRSQFTSLTVGVLGTGAAESLQRAVHQVQGGVVPNRLGHQVSEGGQPTARFVHAEQWLLGDS